MRFDTPIIFERLKPGRYDAATGNHYPAEVEKTERFAAVTNAGESALKLVSGDSGGIHRAPARIAEGALTVRIQGAYEKPFDLIRIGGKAYRVETRRKLRRMETFAVSEVQE